MNNTFIITIKVEENIVKDVFLMKNKMTHDLNSLQMILVIKVMDRTMYAH